MPAEDILGFARTINFVPGFNHHQIILEEVAEICSLIPDSSHLHLAIETGSSILDFNHLPMEACRPIPDFNHPHLPMEACRPIPDFNHPHLPMEACRPTRDSNHLLIMYHSVECVE